jgi:hypothetical protein
VIVFPRPWGIVSLVRVENGGGRRHSVGGVCTSLMFDEDFRNEQTRSYSMRVSGNPFGLWTVEIVIFILKVAFAFNLPVEVDQLSFSHVVGALGTPK